MAIGKCNPAAPVLYGSSAVFAPNPQTYLYSPTDRVNTVGGTGIGFFEELEGRYLSADWIKKDGFGTDTEDTNTATGRDAVVYYANPGKRRSISLQGVAWSYDGTPGAGSGTLAVESPSGTPVFGPLDVTAGGPGFIPFEQVLRCPPNKDVLVRLKPGGPAVKGTVSVQGKRVE